MTIKTDAHGGHGSDARSTDPSPSALPVTFSSPSTTTIADELEILSQAPSSLPPLPPCDGKLVGRADDSSSWALSDCEDMIAELLYPGLPNFPPRQSSLDLTYQMHHLGFAQIFGDRSSPQVEAVTQGIEHDKEPQFSPSLNFQQGWDLVDAIPQNTDKSGSSVFLQQRQPVLQQLVHRQKKRLEDSAVRIVGLEHRLSESQIQNSELQQDNERLQQQNEHLRTWLQQMAKSQVAASWSGIM